MNDSIGHDNFVSQRKYDSRETAKYSLNEECWSRHENEVLLKYIVTLRRNDYRTCVKSFSVYVNINITDTIKTLCLEENKKKLVYN